MKLFNRFFKNVILLIVIIIGVVGVAALFLTMVMFAHSMFGPAGMVAVISAFFLFIIAALMTALE